MEKDRLEISNNIQIRVSVIDGIFYYNRMKGNNKFYQYRIYFKGKNITFLKQLIIIFNKVIHFP
ncbi:hypothetical protein CN288_12835 [Bacillus sp. AFS023182]|nr:hypothetical protein CN288_12835 [Bacillus sp. AFS023182]